MKLTICNVRVMVLLLISSSTAALFPAAESAAKKLWDEVVCLRTILSTAAVFPVADSTATAHQKSSLSSTSLSPDIANHKRLIETAVNNWQVYERVGCPMYEEVREINGGNTTIKYRQCDMGPVGRTCAVLILLAKGEQPTLEQVEKLYESMESTVPKYAQGTLTADEFAKSRVIKAVIVKK